MTISSVSSSGPYTPQNESLPLSEVKETVPAQLGFFDHAVDQFVGFFKWFGGWIESGFDLSQPEPPCDLTPQQKEAIQKIYYESLNILNKLDHPETDEDVVESKDENQEELRVKRQETIKKELATFMDLLLRFHKSRSQQLKAQAEIHNTSFEMARARVKEHQDKEQAELEKMLQSAASSKFWGRLNQAVTPIYTMIGALTLPPGLNVAVICVSLILAAEALTDHSLTKTIAEMAAGDDSEKENLLNQRLQLGASLVSFALAVPVSIDKMPIAILFGIVKAGTSIGQQVSEMDTRTRQGRLTEIRNDAEKWDRKLNDQLKGLKEVNESNNRLNKQALEIVEAQKRTIDAMFATG